LKDTSFIASTIYKKNVSLRNYKQGVEENQNKSHSEKRILISKKKCQGAPRMLYNYNSKSFVNLEIRDEGINKVDEQNEHSPKMRIVNSV
jgi:hypothetical protein